MARTATTADTTSSYSSWRSPSRRSGRKSSPFICPKTKLTKTSVRRWSPDTDDTEELLARSAEQVPRNLSSVEWKKPAQEIARSVVAMLSEWRAGMTSVTSKKSPKVYKKWPNTDFTRKMKYFETFNKLPKMWAIWAKSLLPQALKSCPKCNKLPTDLGKWITIIQIFFLDEIEKLLSFVYQSVRSW